MFTGIITDKGLITSVDDTRGDKRFYIKISYALDKIDIGASIACSGCCLTVIDFDKENNAFGVDVSAETLSKTTLGQWELGTTINLERSLKLGDELGGHMVSGHVDDVAEIVSIIEEGDSRRLKIKVPDNFARFIAPKGSVALDGVSLTVNEVDGTIFGVNIIPHTWDVTTLGQRKNGDLVNLEVDIMARYAARLMEYKG